MPAHAEFIAAFDAALRGEALPLGVTAIHKDEVTRCFAVYRNNVAVGLTDALAARFPVVQRLVGDEFFRAMARLYAEDHRPKSPVLSEWGAEFSGFLAGFPPLAAYPYMPDVARIEWARGRAFHAADAAPMDPARLATATPETLRLALHPSVTVLRLASPAVSIWAKNQPGAQALPVGTGPETALILRDAGFAVHVSSIGTGDAALMDALASGDSLTAAAQAALLAEPGHNPQTVLITLMRAGAIIQRTDQ